MDVAGEQVARRQRQQQHQQIDGESAENGGGAFIPRAALQPGVVPQLPMRLYSGAISRRIRWNSAKVTATVSRK